MVRIDIKGITIVTLKSCIVVGLSDGKVRTIWEESRQRNIDSQMAHPERVSVPPNKMYLDSLYVVVVTNENVLHCCQAPSGATIHINSALREIGAAFRASDYKQIVCKKDNLMHSFMPLAV